MWVEFNENPTGRKTGDCAVRAISAALGVNWDAAYGILTEKGFELGDMPSADRVWGAVLKDYGFLRRSIPNYCPDCYTVRDFASEHFRGVYVLAIGGHVVTVRNGDWWDSWDSGNEVPIYYYYRRIDHAV